MDCFFKKLYFIIQIKSNQVKSKNNKSNTTTLPSRKNTINIIYNNLYNTNNQLQYQSLTQEKFFTYSLPWIIYLLIYSGRLKEASEVLIWYIDECPLSVKNEQSKNSFSFLY